VRQLGAVGFGIPTPLLQPYASRNAVNYPKIILLDIKLPKVSGIEILREIRRHDETRAIRVVMLTFSRENPNIKAAYELGANSYVVKPVDFESFQDAMTSIGLYWLLVNLQPER
jgi:two-component system response regulator